ncbi:MAG: hypothetical protein H7A22_07575 [Spirochaetales bacterium]|nr:hypothetical protein [Spirochaetales bacterium]
MTMRDSGRGLMALLRLMTGLEPGGMLSVVLVSFGSGIGLAFLMVTVLHWIAAIPFLCLAALPFFVLAVALVRYPAFRAFPANLSYTFDGDFSILSRDRSESSCWRQCELRVELLEPKAEDIATVRTGLRAFAQLANKSIYETRWGKIQRWSVEDLQATGEANARVAWKLYRFLSGDLQQLVERGLRVHCVDLKVSSELHHVPAESDSMN